MKYISKLVGFTNIYLTTIKNNRWRQYKQKKDNLMARYILLKVLNYDLFLYFIALIYAVEVLHILLIDRS